MAFEKNVSLKGSGKTFQLNEQVKRYTLRDNGFEETKNGNFQLAGTRLLNQLCAFHGEGGQVDDMVDVCSLVGRGLDEMHNGAIPTAEPSRRPRMDYDVTEESEVNWKTA